MALSQNLVQKQTQKLVMTQDLRQSIELLALSNQELSERIEQELLENPLLEEAPGEDTEQTTPKEPAEKTAPEEDDWRQKMLERETSNTYDTDAEQKHQYLQDSLSSSESLLDHLLWQLQLSELDEEELRTGKILISAIDQRGFIAEELETLLLGTDLSIDLALRIQKQIAAFDPIGCGARNIPESLLFQAQTLREQDTVTIELLRNHFTDIEKLDYKKIEKKTGFTAEEIETALQFIRTLEPYPGTLYSTRRSDYIVPDVVVHEEGGELEVFVNDEWLPSVRINDSYRDMMRANRAREEQEYLQQKFNSANWLLKSVQQRRRTLYRVTCALLEHQQDFFRKGPGHLNPLTLRDIAEKMKLHESNVSRITTHKYVQTRWGIFELKYFFTGGLKNTTGGGARSVKNVQAQIQRLVDEEEITHPLTDQEIVERLDQSGVRIARRTVAKYRKVLKILPADRRKKLKRLNDKNRNVQKNK